MGTETFFLVQINKDGKWVSMSRLRSAENALLLAETYRNADWEARVIPAPSRRKVA